MVTGIAPGMSMEEDTTTGRDLKGICMVRQCASKAGLHYFAGKQFKKGDRCNEISFKL